MKWFRSIALILSIVCLFSIGGCKRQSDPLIESSDVSSATADLPESSQEVLSSVAEEPVPGEPPVVESKPEPEVPSQPEPSSVPEEPLSTVESSEPEAPTLSFMVEYQKVISEAERGFSFLFDDFEKDDQFSHGWFRTRLIRSEAELKEHFDLEQKPEERQAFLEQCDADYFENHAVLYVRMIHTLASLATMTVDPITRSEDQLTVNLHYEGGLPFGDDVFSSEEIFIKVKKSDVEGVTQVVCVSPDDRQNESK